MCVLHRMHACRYAIDGCATFFKRDRFALVKKYEVRGRYRTAVAVLPHVVARVPSPARPCLAHVQQCVMAAHPHYLSLHCSSAADSQHHHAFHPTPLPHPQTSHLKSPSHPAPLHTPHLTHTSPFPLTPHPRNPPHTHFTPPPLPPYPPQQVEFNKAALSLADAFPPDQKKAALNRLLKVWGGGGWEAEWWQGVAGCQGVRVRWRDGEDMLLLRTSQAVD